MIESFNRDPDRPPRTTGVRRLPGAAISLVCALALTPSSALGAQGQNAPLVQVVCEVSGGFARTVRLTYPTAAVRNTHVFRPVPGGPNVVFQAPASANQVYSLAVPAGRYRLSYGDVGPLGNTPVLTQRNAVIDIAPFTVRGRLCERARQPSGPVS